MYKVLIQHIDGGKMYKAGDLVDTVTRADERLAAGLVCEVKVVEVETHDQSSERKRAKRRSADKAGNNHQSDG